MILFNIIFTLVFGWQLQGSAPQLQVTQRAKELQPTTIVLQGDSEDADTLQPALGYGALDGKRP